MRAVSRTGFHENLIQALPRLKRLALALTRNRHAAEDLVQDTVLLALSRQDTYRSDDNFQGWLYRILRNRWVSLTRLQRERADVVELPVSGTASPEDRIVLEELAHALGELRPDSRAALMMTALDGMAYEEVAAVLECAPGTVKSRVNRARQHLQACLAGQERSVAEASPMAARA